jgi:hypothetical protein
MPLAHSNGPRWIRSQTASADKRLRGIAPIRTFLARLLGRSRMPPGQNGGPLSRSGDERSSV